MLSVTPSVIEPSASLLSLHCTIGLESLLLNFKPHPNPASNLFTSMMYILKFVKIEQQYNARQSSNFNQLSELFPFIYTTKVKCSIKTMNSETGMILS